MGIPKPGDFPIGSMKSRAAARALSDGRAAAPKETLRVEVAHGWSGERPPLPANVRHEGADWIVEIVHRFAWLFLLFAALFSSSVRAQGNAVNSAGITILGPSGRPLAGAAVTFCAQGASGIPCTPTITVYSDSALTTPTTNPQISDGNGNVFVYLPPGLYTYTVTGTGIKGKAYTATSACTPLAAACLASADSTYARLDGGNQPFTGNVTAPRIISTVATGTAPLSVTSTTQVPNLNASQLGGLNPPGSTIDGISDANALTNHTFDISVNTLKSSTNTAAHYPRNNGTKYVDSTIQAADVPVFVASGASHAPGAVPDPGASAGTTHFLREDATWATVPAGGVSEAVVSTGLALVTGNGTVCTATTAASCVMFVLPSAHTLVRLILTVNAIDSISGCTTHSQFGIKDLTSGTVLAQSQATNTGIVDSGALSVSMTAGHQFLMGVTTTGAGCAVFASAGVAAVYQ